MSWSSFVTIPLSALLLIACSTTVYRDYSKIVAVTGTDAKVYRQTIRFPGLTLTIIPLNQMTRAAYMGLFVLPIPIAFFEKTPAMHGVFGIKVVLAPGTEQFGLDPGKVFLQWGSNERRAPLGYRQIDPLSSNGARVWRSRRPNDKIPVKQSVCLVLEFPTPTLEPDTSFSIAIEGLEHNDRPLPVTTVRFEKASAWRYTAHLGFKDFVFGSAGGDSDCM